MPASCLKRRWSQAEAPTTAQRGTTSRHEESVGQQSCYHINYQCTAVCNRAGGYFFMRAKHIIGNFEGFFEGPRLWQSICLSWGEGGACSIPGKFIIFTISSLPHKMKLRAVQNSKLLYIQRFRIMNRITVPYKNVRYKESSYILCPVKRKLERMSLYLSWSQSFL